MPLAVLATEECLAILVEMVNLGKEENVARREPKDHRDQLASKDHLESLERMEHRVQLEREEWMVHLATGVSVVSKEIVVTQVLRVILESPENEGLLALMENLVRKDHRDPVAI